MVCFASFSFAKRFSFTTALGLPIESHAYSTLNRAETRATSPTDSRRHAEPVSPPNDGDRKLAPPPATITAFAGQVCV